MHADETPFVDEYVTAIAASVDDVWQALLKTLDRAFSNVAAETYARFVGCAHGGASGIRPLAEGSSIPGFTVVRSTPPSELVLEGSHRFSTYRLVFHVDELGVARSRLRTETYAGFPGVAGGIYRLLVIRSGGHALGVRRLLSRVRREAERGRCSSRSIRELGDGDRV